MTDLPKWNVVGPVHTIRREFAEWDETRQTWGLAKFLTETTLRPDGLTQDSSSHNPDGSVAHSAWLYDANGRLIEAQFWKDDGPKTRSRHFYDSSGRPIRTVDIEAGGFERESERYHYDSTGRKTKVDFLPAPAAGVDMSYAVDGSEQSYGVPGATTSTTTYDEHDLPSEVQFHDASHTLVHTIVFTRDRDGRVLTAQCGLCSCSIAQSFWNA